MIDYQIFRRVERGREGGKCEDECVGYKATSRHARQDQRRAVQSRIGTHQPAPLKKKRMWWG